MRVVVGKSWSQTTTLSSLVKRVVLNPYWHVPGSIIKNEMIPKFKNDQSWFFGKWATRACHDRPH